MLPGTLFNPTFSRVVLVKPGKSQHETFPALPFPPKRGESKGGREDHIYMSHSRPSQADIPGRESLRLRVRKRHKKITVFYLIA